MPITFLVLGGWFGVSLGRGGGWNCQFYFYGRGDFSDLSASANDNFCLPTLSGSDRPTHIAGDLASPALASQAKPQQESDSQVFRIARF